MSVLKNINKLLQEGQLMAALDFCKESIRNSPSQIQPRVALYELSVFQGDWNRCKNQVETIMSLGGDPLHWLSHMATIHASEARSLCWQGQERPSVVGNCDSEEKSMFDDLWQAIISAANGDVSPTEKNTTNYGGMVFGPGKINGQEFHDISTIDSRLPGVLEISDGGDYAWLWLGAVSRIEMQGGAKNLTEVMWIPARVFLTNGDIKAVNIFGLYPETESSNDPKIVVGRGTEWSDNHETLSIGKGGQLLYVDEQPIPFQQIRMIEFDTADKSVEP